MAHRTRGASPAAAPCQSESVKQTSPRRSCFSPLSAGFRVLPHMSSWTSGFRTEAGLVYIATQRNLIVQNQRLRLGEKKQDDTEAKGPQRA